MDNPSIKKIRVWHGLTQAEMGELLGLAKSTYSQKEQKLINWTLADVINVKKHFGIDIDELQEIKDLM